MSVVRMHVGLVGDERADVMGEVSDELLDASARWLVSWTGRPSLANCDISSTFVTGRSGNPRAIRSRHIFSSEGLPLLIVEAALDRRGLAWCARNLCNRPLSA